MKVTINRRKIEELRYAQGLAIKALAEKAGVSRLTVSSMIAGNTTPQVGTLKKVADALLVDIRDVVSIEEEQEK